MGLLITILAFVFIIGLCVGSFLNVVVLRSLSEESIIFPASKCPKCQNKLKWWHNIPVISYICLGGKCAFCKEKISIQYPIIELVTGLIFTVLFLKFGLSLNTLFVWIIASLLIVIAGTDIKEKVVFDAHTYSLVAVGLIYALCATGIYIWQIHSAGIPLKFSMEILLFNPITNSLLGILLGVVIMEVLARAGYLVAGTRAFGEGDTYIAAGLGAIFGWKTLILVLILSVLIQVIIFLPIFVVGLIKNKEWKTLASFVSFLIYAVVFYSLQKLNILTSDTIIAYIIATVIMAILGIICCGLIFKGLKDKPENRTYLPFGPAMVGAALFTLILI